MSLRRSVASSATLFTSVLVVAALSGASLLAPPASAVPVGTAVTQAAPLTNLAHLDFLVTTVEPPAQAGHSTYRLDAEPAIGTLWTYADRNADGSYRLVGGGEYDAATDTWGQGAFNADDVSRAAIVYLRHWQQTGSASSRAAAYQMLRGLAYLQTDSGPDAGNVVLWMQPDGTLNPSADPVELPDPSDSDESYWLARTIWALGEGYAAFSRTGASSQDAEFAEFLKNRLDLSSSAVERQTLARYGRFITVDGKRTPAWLITNGGDATAEAILGLSAYVDAGAPASTRRTLDRLADGLSALSAGDARTWPFGAIMPWALSRSFWHAWGSQAPAALARASDARNDPGLARTAVKDSAVFVPWLLTSGGPDNGRMPTPGDRTQIAYGVDSRVQSLVATAEATGQQGPRRLAGMTAAWLFGANASGQPAYDPATGRTVDGINAEGVPNRNAGAESTIHGLLTTLVLDANPDIAEIARTATVVEREGSTTLQAEDGILGGAATPTVPASTWTGESQFGGTGYVALGSGGTVTLPVVATQGQLVMPVFDFQRGSSATTTFSSGRTLGTVRSDAIGPQGASPAPGALLPVTLPAVLPAGSTTLRAATRAAGGDVARLDAVMLEPLVSRLVLAGDGHGTALLRSVDRVRRTVTLDLGGEGTARVESYDGAGVLRSVTTSDGTSVPVRVLPGGYSVARR